MRARANIGAERDVEGWDCFDLIGGEMYFWDVRCPMDTWNLNDNGGRRVPVVDRYDYAVCSFMLQELTFHELPGAVKNIYDIIRPGGILRVMVPDFERAILAYRNHDEAWFPQDERTGGLDEKYCTYLTWYGTVRTLFTPTYMRNLLATAGFKTVLLCGFGMSRCAPALQDEITSLDSRPKESMIFEAVK